MLTEVSATFWCWTRANIARSAVPGFETKIQALSKLIQRNWGFFSVRPSVHTNPEKLFIDNAAFESALQVWRIEDACFAFWTKNISKEVLFNNNDVTIMRLTLNGVSAAGYFFFFEISSALCQNWKHMMRFQSENAVFKFILRSVGVASDFALLHAAG